MDHVPAGQKFEAPVVLCAHCQAGMMMNPLRTRQREWCAKCDRYICDRCALVLKVSGDCQSFERVLARIHDKAVLLGS
jgi:hypothetical protein